MSDQVTQRFRKQTRCWVTRKAESTGTEENAAMFPVQDQLNTGKVKNDHQITYRS
jgi:hypothetical protein